MNFKHTLTRIGSTALVAAATPAAFVHAVDNPFLTANTNLGPVGTESGLSTTSNVYQIAGKIINVVLSFLGIVLLGYLIYAGFLWMTSGGESEKAGEAQTMIRNAIIGLIIIVAAFAISNFVLTALVNISR